MTARTNAGKSSNAATTDAPVGFDMTDVPTVDDYAAASGGDRTRIRSAWSAAMASAVGAGDMNAATVVHGYMSAADAMTVRASTARAVDWTALVAGRIATLRDAAERLSSGMVTPTGCTSDDIDYDRLSSMLDGWSELTDDADARKLATARVGGRIAIVPWIDAAVSGYDAGSRLSVADIIRGKSDAPGNGAVSAALNAIHAGTRDASDAWTVAPADSDGPLGIIVA